MGLKLVTTTFAIGSLVVSGCTSLAADKGQIAAPHAEPTTGAQEVLPQFDLTAEVLNAFLVAEVAVQRGHYDIAVAMYRQLALETGDPRIIERATRVALFSRDYDTAMEMGRMWVELVPDNLDGRQIVTALAVREGDFNEALTHLEWLLQESQSEDDDERTQLVLRLLGREQDRDGARSLVEKYLERHPNDNAALFAYAQLALRDGQTDTAEQAVGKLLEMKPDWPEAAVLRTRILKSTGRESEALDYLDGVVNRAGKDTKLRTTYGRMLVDAGRSEEALEQFDRVIKIEPDNEGVLYAAGLVALRLEKLDQAEGYFRRLNGLGARQPDARYYLGRIAEEKDQIDEAIGWYDKISNGEHYLTARIRVALLKARQGDVDAARAHLHAVQASNPGHRLRLYLAEGEILREIKHYSDALEVYNRALEEIPDNTELLYARAMIAERLDRLDILEQDLLTVLEREPDHVNALNSLGYTLADRTNRHEEAYNYIKRALELSPDAFYILDSMGWVHYRMGNIEESLKYLRRAINLNYDPEIAAHLGEVLWVMGDREEARTIWDNALEKSPENEILMNVIERLSQ